MLTAQLYTEGLQWHPDVSSECALLPLHNIMFFISTRSVNHKGLQWHPDVSSESSATVAFNNFCFSF